MADSKVVGGATAASLAVEAPGRGVRVALVLRAVYEGAGFDAAVELSSITVVRRWTRGRRSVPGSVLCGPVLFIRTRPRKSIPQTGRRGEHAWFLVCSHASAREIQARRTDLRQAPDTRSEAVSGALRTRRLAPSCQMPFYQDFCCT